MRSVDSTVAPAWAAATPAKYLRPRLHRSSWWTPLVHRRCRFLFRIAARRPDIGRAVDAFRRCRERGAGGVDFVAVRTSRRRTVAATDARQTSSAPHARGARLRPEPATQGREAEVPSVL